MLTRNGKIKVYKIQKNVATAINRSES